MPSIWVMTSSSRWVMLWRIDGVKKKSRVIEHHAAMNGSRCWFGW
jgi:hypothetical protein